MGRAPFRTEDPLSPLNPRTSRSLGFAVLSSARGPGVARPLGASCARFARLANFGGSGPRQLLSPRGELSPDRGEEPPKLIDPGSSCASRPREVGICCSACAGTGTEGK